MPRITAFDLEKSAEKTASGFGIAALLVVIYGLGFDVVQWLRYGEGHTTTGWLLGQFLIPPGWVASLEPWVGVRKLVGWFVDLPIYINLTGILGACAWVAGSVSGDLAKKRYAAMPKDDYGERNCREIEPEEEYAAAQCKVEQGREVCRRLCAGAASEQASEAEVAFPTLGRSATSGSLLAEASAAQTT